MRITVRPAIVLSFSSRAGRAVTFLLLASVRAAVLSYFVFAAYCYPLDHLRWLKPPVLLLARLVDVPIATLGVLVPPLRTPVSFLRPISMLGFDGILDPRWVLMAHMRAGIITYVFLFHVPAFFRLLRQRLKGKPPPSGESTKSLA